MKVTTKTQLLTVLIVISLVIYSAVAAICWYFFDMQLVVPLFAGAVFSIIYQFNVRKKFLANKE